MRYYTYIIKSQQNLSYYIGSCEDVKIRLQQHNAGKVRSTKNKGLYKIVHLEEFQTRREAYRRERQIKSYKGGRAFKNLVDK